MNSPSTMAGNGRSKTTARVEQSSQQMSVEHYLRVLVHRKWLVLIIFLAACAITGIVSYHLPNVYSSETLILVDPQKVPESYVKATVTGDVRNRLGTLSQQILSATRLQKIIELFNLFPEERKTLPREDVIALMRSNISVSVVSDFGTGDNLQAFRITYSGREPRTVAQVTNELASLFIEENLKVREQQATGTTEFLDNQLQDTRKTLEQQEAKLKDFKLKHIGEMPEQQAATMQIMGQLQAQLQSETDGLARAEDQKTYVESMIAQSSAPIVDLDDSSSAKNDATPSRPAGTPSSAPANTLSSMRARLATLQARYTDRYPEVQKLKRQIEEESSKTGSTVAAPEPAAPESVSSTASVSSTTKDERTSEHSVRPPVTTVNPILRAQLQNLDEEIAKHKAERARLTKLSAGYQGKLESIPIREQEMMTLVRDYEMSKSHYGSLLDKELSAQTATQLEIRQKGERFSILDPAQPAQRPSKPNRLLINVGGDIGGLMLGVVLALCTEFLGISITSADQMVEVAGVPVLEVIPMIVTDSDRRRGKKRVMLAVASVVVATVLVSGATLLYFRYLTF